MSDLPQLLEGNRRFTAHFADGELPIRPDLQLGDALVIRNGGGRINPGVLDASGFLLKMCNGEGTEKNIETPGPKPQLLKEFKACGDPGGRRWRP